MIRRTLLRAMLVPTFAMIAWGHVLAADPPATPAAEASPSAVAIRLLKVQWQLESLTRADGTTMTPATPANHTIQLLGNGRVLLQADCNSGSGQYTLNGSSLTFSGLVTSLMACPEPTGSEFAAALTHVTGFSITTEASDQLTLTTRNGESLRFSPGLHGVIWKFTRFRSGKGTSVTVDDPSRYTLQFTGDNQIVVQADCNRGKGTATVAGSSIDITLALTRAACPPGSRGTEYAGYLDEAVSWVIRDGQLHLALPMDAGIASFTPVIPPEAAATPYAG